MKVGNGNDVLVEELVAEIAAIHRMIKKRDRAVDPDTPLTELGLDSLETLELLVLLEERCQAVLIGEPALVDVHTVADLHRMILRR